MLTSLQGWVLFVPLVYYYRKNKLISHCHHLLWLILSSGKPRSVLPCVSMLRCVHHIYSFMLPYTYMSLFSLFLDQHFPRMWVRMSCNELHQGPYWWCWILDSKGNLHIFVYTIKHIWTNLIVNSTSDPTFSFYLFRWPSLDIAQVMI